MKLSEAKKEGVKVVEPNDARGAEQWINDNCSHLSGEEKYELLMFLMNPVEEKSKVVRKKKVEEKLEHATDEEVAEAVEAMVKPAFGGDDSKFDE